MTQILDVIKDLQREAYGSSPFVPYNLSPGARLINPVLTPFRNITTRRPIRKRIWRDEETGKHYAGMFMLRHPDDPTAVILDVPIGIQGMHTKLTFETLKYEVREVDAKALSVASLLRSVMIGEESNLLFGQCGHPELCVGDLFQASPQAYDGLFAQLLDQIDYVYFDFKPDNLIQGIGEMAAAMAEANGAPPDLCFVNAAQAGRIVREVIDSRGGLADFEGMPIRRVSGLPIPGWDETISVQAHPFFKEGECLLLTTSLPEKIQTMVTEHDLSEQIPAPWSFSYVYDYLQLDNTKFPSEQIPSLTEIRLMGAFMLHCPFLVGWIRGCPS